MSEETDCKDNQVRPVKITNVLILVERPVGLALIARSTIMLLFADVLQDLQEIAQTKSFLFLFCIKMLSHIEF